MPTYTIALGKDATRMEPTAGHITATQKFIRSFTSATGYVDVPLDFCLGNSSFGTALWRDAAVAMGSLANA